MEIEALIGGGLRHGAGNKKPAGAGLGLGGGFFAWRGGRRCGGLKRHIAVRQAPEPEVVFWDIEAFSRNAAPRLGITQTFATLHGVNFHEQISCGMVTLKLPKLPSGALT
jgi:hypothetical protein